MSRRFMTTTQADQLPSLQGLDDAGRDQLLADAASLHSTVTAQPWIGEPALRTGAEREGIDPDRVTRALAFLAEAGHLLTIPDTPPLPVGAPLPDLESLTVEALQKIAADLNIAGRSAMTKAELIDAITATAETTA